MTETTPRMFETAPRMTRWDVDRAMRAVTSPASVIVPERDAALKRAAVLCPIVERNQGLAVILTLRSPHLKAHPGQISFPGGKIDATDRSPLSAALREAEEEIGLLSQHVEIAGSLDAYSTGTGFLVTPFVGHVDPRFRAVPEPGEVEEVFEVPLDFLMDPSNHARESYTRDGRTRHFYVMMFGRYRIWGATAGMLKMLSDRIADVAGPETAGSIA